MQKTRHLSLLLLLSLLLTACTASRPATVPEQPAGTPRRVEVVAHRGGLPENTLSAFRAALATPGVAAIETDVQMTKDGVPVIIHDATVDRTTNGTGKVADMTLAELQKLKTPKDGTEAVPTLDEVAKLVAEHPSIRFFLEIKHPAPSGTAEKVLAVVKKYKIESQTVIMSFEAGMVTEVQTLAPDQETCYLARELSGLVLASPAQVLGIKHTKLTADQVKEAQARGKQVYVWTVNEEPVMTKMLSIGVDGLISDQYGLAVKVRDAAAGK